MLDESSMLLLEESGSTLFTRKAGKAIEFRTGEKLGENWRGKQENPFHIYTLLNMCEHFAAKRFVGVGVECLEQAEIQFLSMLPTKSMSSCQH